MDRLTNADHKEIGFYAYTGKQNPYSVPLTLGELALSAAVTMPEYNARKILDDVFALLAAYEDTGLTPEEMQNAYDACIEWQENYLKLCNENAEIKAGCEKCDIARRDFEHSQDPQYTRFAIMQEEIETLRAALAHAEAENERYTQWVNDLQSGMYVNCVYCGHRYGPEDEVPTSMADALKEHIEQCPQHPMSQLKAENEQLRANAVIQEQIIAHGGNPLLQEEVVRLSVENADLRAALEHAEQKEE